MTPESYCQRKAAQSGSSFYYSFLFLPPLKRQAMLALYAFCREVDDIVDTAKEIQVARAKLSWWSDELDRLYQGNPEHPITKALQPHIEVYHWDRQWFKDIIHGMRMDLEPPEYETLEDLIQYCYYVAGIVGILSTRIFGFQNEQTLEFSKNLGISLQLINIIRDVREDAKLGRIYLPTCFLNEFNITSNDIISLNVDSQKLSGLLNKLAQQSKRYFESALLLLPEIDRYDQLPGLVMGNIYHELLKQIELDGYQVLDHKISLPPLRKLLVAWKTKRAEKKRHKKFIKTNDNQYVAP